MLNVQRPVLRWSALSLFSWMMELEKKPILRGKRWKLGVEKDWSGVEWSGMNWIELDWKGNEMFMFMFMFKRMIWFSIQNFKLSVFSFFIIAFFFCFSCHTFCVFLFPAHFLWLLSNCHTFLAYTVGWLFSFSFRLWILDRQLKTFTMNKGYLAFFTTTFFNVCF